MNGKWLPGGIVWDTELIKEYVKALISEIATDAWVEMYMLFL